MTDSLAINTHKSLIQKKLETLKGAGLGNSVAEEKHEDMKQEKEEEFEDGFDDDDDFDELVAQLDSKASDAKNKSSETIISKKRKSDSTNIPDAKKKSKTNKPIPSSDNQQNSSSVDIVEQDTDIESNHSKNDTFDEDFPLDFEE